MNGWNNPKPDMEVAEYLEGKTGKPPIKDKKYGVMSNPWSKKAQADVLNYLETGKSDEPNKKAKKTPIKNATTGWSPRPDDDLLKYLGGNGAGGRIGEKLAQAMAEPDIEDYIETFEKWSKLKDFNHRYGSDKEAYDAVGKFKPLPATVEQVQEFLDKKRGAERAGLFASYCLNEVCHEDEIELHVERAHNFLGAYNSGKNWRIHGNVGDKTGLGMSGGELIVEGGAGHQFCEEMSGGKAVLYGSAGHFAGEGMTGGELRVNGSAQDCPGHKMQDGFITVQGNAGEAAGCEMKGGKVVVGGDAGDDAGKRMKDGELVVMGNAGRQPGLAMRGGILTIGGDVNDKAGRSMDGGELRINGKLSRGWTYELGYGITGGNIFHNGKQLYRDGKRVRKWLIF